MTHLRIRSEPQGFVVFDPVDHQSRYVAREMLDIEAPMPELFEQVGLLLGKDLLGREITILRNRVDPSLELTSPMAVYLEIGDRCNLSCQHCYKGKVIPGELVPTERLLEVIDEIADMGVFELRITGYEPVISPRLELLCTYAQGRGISLVLNTNGSYGKTYIERVLRIGFDEIIVSLDGLRDKHDSIRGRGSFDRAVNVLAAVSESGVRTRVNTAVSHRNMDEMRDIVALAAAFGSYVNFLPLRTGGLESDLKKNEGLDAADMLQIVKTVIQLRAEFPHTRILTYFDILENSTPAYHSMWMCSPCPARKNLYISCKGDTYPCDFLSYLGDTYSGGNISNQTIGQIWAEGVGLQRYRDLPRPEECTSCALLGKTCHGGCASETLAARAIYEDPLCFKHLLPARDSIDA